MNFVEPQVVLRMFYESEQVVEETHQKFSIFWERYKVLDLESEIHGTNLLNCLIYFNTKKHLKHV